MDKLTTLHLSLGPLLAILAYLYLRFPPKKINPIYGYRTPRSMRSQEAWDCANAYSGKALLIVAGSTCLIQLVTYSLMRTEDSIFWSAIFMVSALVLAIPITEVHLRTKGFK